MKPLAHSAGSGNGISEIQATAFAVFFIALKISELNHALKIYLGAGATGGFQPIGCDERLKAAFPNGHARIKAMISVYLDEIHPPENWSATTLAGETAVFEKALAKKFPELDENTVRALASRWSFDNR